MKVFLLKLWLLISLKQALAKTKLTWLKVVIYKAVWTTFKSKPEQLKIICPKKFLYFRVWNFPVPEKNVIKTFRTLNKTPLGEIGCLSNLYHLLAAQHWAVWFTSLSQIQSVRIPLVRYHLLCSTCVRYGMQCHAIGHQVFPT